MWGKKQTKSGELLQLKRGEEGKRETDIRTRGRREGLKWRGMRDTNMAANAPGATYGKMLHMGNWGERCVGELCTIFIILQV